MGTSLDVREHLALLQLVAYTESLPERRRWMTVQWLVTRSTNPMDDSETISASLDASKGKREGKPIRLLVRFNVQTGKINAYVDWHSTGFIGAERYRCAYRFPPEAAQTEIWRISNDFRDDDGYIIEDHITSVRDLALFVNKLFKSKRLVVQLMPQDDYAPITAVFDLPSQPTQLNRIMAAG